MKKDKSSTIQLKSIKDINAIKKSAKLAANTIIYLSDYIYPGMTTRELDKKAERHIISHKGRPAFKGYRGYPSSICTSVNEEIIHGIPSNYELKNGDIIGIDIGVEIDGYFGDVAYTFSVGEISESSQKLLTVTKNALKKAIESIKPDIRLVEISRIIQNYAEQKGYSVVRDYCGHGTGFELHEVPEIPNYDFTRERNGTVKDMILLPGMVLAIEPMINQGGPDLFVLDDGWTVVTTDGLPSAHFEHTVAVMPDGTGEILTQLKW